MRWVCNCDEINDTCTEPESANELLSPRFFGRCVGIAEATRGDAPAARPRITSYFRLPDPASLTKYRPPSQVILQQHPECIDNLLQNMMNAYENFAEIKEQILNITTRGAGGGGGGGGGDADD